MDALAAVLQGQSRGGTVGAQAAAAVEARPILIARHDALIISDAHDALALLFDGILMCGAGLIQAAGVLDADPRRTLGPKYAAIDALTFFQYGYRASMTVVFPGAHIKEAELGLALLVPRAYHALAPVVHVVGAEKAVVRGAHPVHAPQQSADLLGRITRHCTRSMHACNHG